MATESREMVGVVMVPMPELLLANLPALEQSASALAEPAVTPDEEREWDVVEQRYRTRAALKDESADAAQETRELSAPPDESKPDKTE